ncbi:MAG: hypothetical protein WCC97_08470 [Candidatus Acidiferrales bacterium]
MHPVDQQIVIAAQAGDERKVEELQSRVFEAFWETQEGSSLRDTGISTSILSSRLIDEFKRRFEGDNLYPGVPFVFRFQEIADDLMRSEAIKVAPRPEVVTEADEHANKVAKFKAMMADPKVSTFAIRELRAKSPEWAKAWQDAMALETVAPPEPAQTEQHKRLKQFAHLVNESVAARGAGSISPKGGIVTVHAGGKGYEYPAAEFRQQLEAATIAGLIN